MILIPRFVCIHTHFKLIRQKKNNDNFRFFFGSHWDQQNEELKEIEVTESSSSFGRYVGYIRLDLIVLQRKHIAMFLICTISVISTNTMIADTLIIIHSMSDPDGKSYFCSPESPDVSRDEVDWKHQDSREDKTKWFPVGSDIKCLLHLQTLTSTVTKE